MIRIASIFLLIGVISPLMAGEGPAPFHIFFGSSILFLIAALGGKQ
jgi:hypothetical protein